MCPSKVLKWATPELKVDLEILEQAAFGTPPRALVLKVIPPIMEQIKHSIMA